MITRTVKTKMKQMMRIAKSKFIDAIEYDPFIPLSPIRLLCGNTAEFDEDSGIGFRCERCFAIIGSIGMPRECKTLYDMQEVIDKLKGM